MKLYNSYFKLVYYSLNFSRFKYAQFLDYIKLSVHYTITFILYKIIVICLELF